jgi:hypothetical protein
MVRKDRALTSAAQFAQQVRDYLNAWPGDSFSVTGES